VIDEEGEQLGIMPPAEALRKAREQGLDLVEVAPTANPPVCRIINYGKFLYQLNKREHEARKHQRSAGLKEVKMRPRISEHDFGVKRNRVVEFLQEGSKVKATIMFRGREMAHRELGMKLMMRLSEEVSATGQLETRPRQEGPNLSAIFSPVKKTAGKTSGAAQRPAAPRTRPAPVAAGKVQEGKVAKVEAENA
jgi:translation initiation factor IF-3